ncbi:MAG: NUDIX hydrolase [Desulfitobacteriaceae bacterium]
MLKKDFREECLNQELIFEGRVISLHRDTVSLPNSQKVTREVIKHPGAVAVIATNEEGLLLVRQYRYAIKSDLREIPAGKLDAGEEPINCALRELREETGYRGDLTPLGTFYSTPGFSDETMHLFWATNLVWDPLHLDEDEFLEVEVIPWKQALQMVENGEFRDAKTVLGILLVQGKLG